MPRTTRKTRVPFNPGQTGKGHDLPAVVLSLAAEYGINPASLLDWKVYPGSKVVLIAPNGMKLVREIEAPESLRPAAVERPGTPTEANVVADLAGKGGTHAC